MGRNQVFITISTLVPSFTWKELGIERLVIFCPCILNLLVKFVSSGLEAIELPMVMDAKPHTPDFLLVPWTP
jgi:hypothetical protein